MYAIVDSLLSEKPGNKLDFTMLMSGTKMYNADIYLLKFELTDDSLGIIRQFFEGKALGHKMILYEHFEVLERHYTNTNQRILDSLKQDFEPFDNETDAIIKRMQEAYKKDIDLIPIPDNFVHMKEFGLMAMLKDFYARLKSKQVDSFENHSPHIQKYFRPGDYIKMTKTKADFRNLEFQYFKDSRTVPVYEHKLKTLENYVYDHPCDVDIEEIHNILVKAQHV